MWPPDKATNFIRYDLEAAKKKMTEAGLASGVTFDFKYSATSGDVFSPKLAETLQNMLKKIGVNLTLTPLENPQVL